MTVDWKPAVAIWLALLALLAATVGGAYVPMGGAGTALELGIAAIKVVLVGLFFMRLHRSSARVRLAAVAGLFWLGILFTLTFSDLLTRHWG